MLALHIFVTTLENSYLLCFNTKITSSYLITIISTPHKLNKTFGKKVAPLASRKKTDHQQHFLLKFQKLIYVITSQELKYNYRF